MTEDEAKTKWCPMVRYHVISNGSEQSMNRDMDDDDDLSAKCIGSTCMMWRRTSPHWEKCETIHNEYVKPKGDGWEWRSNIVVNMAPTPSAWYREIKNNGYCGLAGKLT